MNLFNKNDSTQAMNKNSAIIAITPIQPYFIQKSHLLFLQHSNQNNRKISRVRMLVLYHVMPVCLPNHLRLNELQKAKGENCYPYNL